MTTPIALHLDLAALAEEGVDLEYKRATGRSGTGELPKSFWATYSAMANTSGGLIILGIHQKRNEFLVYGIEEMSGLQKTLWDSLNNQQIVSINLLDNEDVVPRVVEEKTVLAVRVPRAKRGERPVYIGPNPMTGTYRRGHEGDYLCDEETVRRMLAERVEDVRDRRVLSRFTMDDIHIPTLQKYRNRMAGIKPDHPFLSLDDQPFLKSLGGFARDRESGEEGLTLAGLLMFGQLNSIFEAVPHYVVDYQERPRAYTELRWVDRVTTDGTWAGNLFEFYLLVIGRLYRDVKVPFQLERDLRVDSSTVHVALREALVNTIIHADYTGRSSILVVKRPDLFGFRNPGTMRVPVDEAIEGGLSDCRNRTLQKMFQLVGLGEQAGSGVPKIYIYWTEQWRRPILVESVDREETTLTLFLASLLPPNVLTELDDRVGPEFRKMPNLERLALATVAIEGQVTHPRLKSMCAEHPHDITRALASLVREGHLDSSGVTRSKYYYFPGEPPKPDSGPEPSRLLGSSEHLAPDSEHLEALMLDAEEVRSSGKCPREKVERAIIAVARTRYLTLKQLAHILGRSENTIRQNYLSKMVEAGQIRLRYPGVPRHPRQAYTSAEMPADP